MNTNIAILLSIIGFVLAAAAFGFVMYKTGYYAGRRDGPARSGAYIVKIFEGTLSEIYQIASIVEASGGLWEIDESYTGAKHRMECRFPIDFNVTEQVSNKPANLLFNFRLKDFGRRGSRPYLSGRSGKVTPSEAISDASIRNGSRRRVPDGSSGSDRPGFS